MFFFVFLDECSKNGNFEWFLTKECLSPLGVNHFGDSLGVFKGSFDLIIVEVYAHP